MKSRNRSLDVVAVVLALALCLPAFARNRDDARKAFLADFSKAMATDVVNAVPMVCGKSGEVLEIWLPQASAAYVITFEEKYIEPMKVGAYKKQMKALGFKTVELRSDDPSTSSYFANGALNVSLAHATFVSLEYQ